MSLRTLSDVSLLNRITRLTRSERSFTLRVLECLIEVEWRKLHFAFGYSSMFNFCTSGLGYSGSAAGRRIQAARAARRFPEVMQLLRANEVNVCTVSRIARVLTPENKDELLSRIRRKSLDDVIAIVAEYRPPDAPVRDQVRNVTVAQPTRPLLDSMPWRQAGAAAGAHGDPVRPGGTAGTDGTPDQSSGALIPAGGWSRGHQRDAVVAGPLDGDGHAPASAGDLEQRIILRFGVSADFMEKVERLRALTWHRLPANASLEQVFELALDETLKRTDPLQRREQRSRRESARAARDTGAPPPVNEEVESSRMTPPARQIPARVRDEVFARDGGRCVFVAPDGRRCDATHGLQIDHIVPVARGGGGDIDNLRLLCAHHNRLMAERLFGRRRGNGADAPPHPARE